MMGAHRSIVATTAYSVVSYALLLGSVSAQTQVAQAEIPADGPEARLLRALAADPFTANYRFAVTRVGRELRLEGRVGTRAVYDSAIRTALATGVTFIDRLVIDTAAVYEARAQQPQAVAVAVGAWNWPPPTYQAFSGPWSTYLYPPPLFGRVDEPFWGFEPPAISYPPWWPELSDRRLRMLARDLADEAAAVAQARGMLDDRGEPGVAQGADGQKAPPPPPTPEPPAADDGPPIDPRGARRAEPIRPFRVGDVATNVPQPAGPRSNEAKVAEALRAVPELSRLPVKAEIRDGVATLDGPVPSVVEAMLAFDSVSKAPGVVQVVDRMSFPVPGIEGRNPLLDWKDQKAVDSYLGAQVRRQVDGLIVVDTVRVEGDRVLVRGRLLAGVERARVEAVLRTTAVLRGYQLSVELGEME